MPRAQKAAGRNSPPERKARQTRHRSLPPSSLIGFNWPLCTQVHPGSSITRPRRRRLSIVLVTEVMRPTGFPFDDFEPRAA